MDYNVREDEDISLSKLIDEYNEQSEDPKHNDSKKEKNILWSYLVYGVTGGGGGCCCD